MKSLGTGWRGIGWKDIEITGGGKPTVRMFGNAARIADGAPTHYEIVPAELAPSGV